MSDPIAMAERLEKAGAEEQQVLLLIQGWEAINGHIPHDDVAWDHPWSRFRRKIDAEAYESAAMMLLPKNCAWTIEEDSAWIRWMGKGDVEEAQGHLTGRNGKCTGLAIAAACLRAHASIRRESHKDSGRPSATCSRPSGRAPTGLDASRFDQAQGSGE
jgi:hypothetical protein